jgi:isocitrate/isopropylmalate dehydrogenase
MNQNKSAYTIAVIPGDGIGPEIVEAAGAILTCVAELDNFTVDLIP